MSHMSAEPVPAAALRNASPADDAAHGRGETPRYFQTKLRVQELIAGLRQGDSLPAERQLATQLGVARSTLRKALGELQAEGVLRRTHGSGTYVAPPKVVRVRQLTSFTDDFGASGSTVASTILAIERVKPEPDVAAGLELGAGDSVCRVTRLRLVDDEPLAIEVANLPGPLPGLRRRLGSTDSLYRLLRERYGREVVAVEDTVETALASPAEAELLDVPIGHPLLLVHRQGRDADGVAIEWTRSAYRGDRFRFVARATRA